MIERLDVIAILGLVLLAAGLWWFWPPLALIVIGALLLILALAGLINRAVEGKQK